MTKPASRETLRGIVLLIISVSLFAIVDGMSKVLADSQSVGQIVWARYAFSIPVLIAATPPSRWTTLFRTVRPIDQIIRGIVPLVIGVAMVLAVYNLPLAEATVIMFAGPFLVVALSGPFLGEKVRSTSWIGVCIGFLALLLVTRPGFAGVSAAIIYPLIAAVFFAFFHLFTRRLGAAGEAPLTTLAWTLLIGVIGSTPVAIYAWSPPSGVTWALLVTLGVVFGLAQILTIQAFTHAPANVLTPFSYAQIIAAVIFGMAVFGAVPEWQTFLGIAIMIAAGAYVMRSQAN